MAWSVAYNADNALVLTRNKRTVVVSKSAHVNIILEALSDDERRRVRLGETVKTSRVPRRFTDDQATL